MLRTAVQRRDFARDDPIMNGTDSLSALDTMFLHLEDEHAALHIGAVAVFEGSPPSAAELDRRYREVAAGSPRYRQVLQRAPLDVVRPR